jgi:hypothetical protein
MPRIACRRLGDLTKQCLNVPKQHLSDRRIDAYLLSQHIGLDPQTRSGHLDDCLPGNPAGAQSSKHPDNSLVSDQPNFNDLPLLKR